MNIGPNKQLHEKNTVAIIPEQLFHNSQQYIDWRDFLQKKANTPNFVHLNDMKILSRYYDGESSSLQVSKFNLFVHKTKNILLGATNIKHSPWGIAFNESQRMAIEADGTFGQEDDNAGINGMKAARSIGLISYRNYKAYNITQHDEDNSKLENFKACGYQRYQGEKLAKRFNAYSYYILSKAMDNHNIERGRGAAKEVLKNIKSNIIVLGIKSDFLYPLEEQELMASLMPHSTFVAIDSHFGHDGFLIENEQISKILSTFLKA